MSVVKKANGIILSNFYSTAIASASSTADTKTTVVGISGNTFKNGDIITVSTGCYNDSGVNGWNVSFYWNTANTLTNAIKISTIRVGSGNEYCQFSRLYYISDSTGAGDGTDGLNANSSSTYAYENSGSVLVNVATNYALDWTKDCYVMTALSSDVGPTTIYSYWLKVTTF
jgi:hypothetical protein